MDLRKSSITADILNFLSDGKIHTMQEIANAVEVSWHTVQRHIQSLSYRYPIETFHGGDNRGGVFLDRRFIVNGRIITNEKLQILGRALELLQNSNCEGVDPTLLKELISDFSPAKKIKKEDDHGKGNDYQR